MMYRAYMCINGMTCGVGEHVVILVCLVVLGEIKGGKILQDFRENTST